MTILCRGVSAVGLVVLLLLGIQSPVSADPAQSPNPDAAVTVEASVPIHPVVDRGACSALPVIERIEDSSGACAPDRSAAAVGSCVYFGDMFVATPPFPASLIPGSRWAHWESRWYCTNLGDPIVVGECTTTAAWIGTPTTTFDADYTTGFFCWNTGTIPPALTVKGLPSGVSSHSLLIGASGNIYAPTPVYFVRTVP